ncbi:MAG: hypothetical protein ACE5H0_14890 [Bacteroidota bacterium]
MRKVSTGAQLRLFPPLGGRRSRARFGFDDMRFLMFLEYYVKLEEH